MHIPDPGPTLHAVDANGQSDFGNSGSEFKLTLDPSGSGNYTNTLFPNPLYKTSYSQQGTNRIVGFLNVGCSYVLGPSASFTNATVPPGWLYTYKDYEGTHVLKFYGLSTSPAWDQNLTQREWEAGQELEFLFGRKLVFQEYRTWGGDIGVTVMWMDPHQGAKSYDDIQSGYDHLESFGIRQTWHMPTPPAN